VLYFWTYVKNGNLIHHMFEINVLCMLHILQFNSSFWERNKIYLPPQKRSYFRVLFRKQMVNRRIRFRRTWKIIGFCFVRMLKIKRTSLETYVQNKPKLFGPCSKNKTSLWKGNLRFIGRLRHLVTFQIKEQNKWQTNESFCERNWKIFFS
jgi:hypothetical protein